MSELSESPATPALNKPASPPPSVPAQSPAQAVPPTTTLGDLPLEVLGLIAREARRKDEAYADFVARLRAGERLDSDYLPCSPGRTVSWRGRSVFALSLVNKRLRMACLPILCKQLSSRQLTSPLYRLGRLPAGLTTGVEHVVCDSLGFDGFVTLTAALPSLKLPKVLTIDLGNLRSSDFQHHAHNDNFVIDTFRQSTLSAKRVTLRNHKPGTDTEVLARLLIPLAVQFLKFSRAAFCEELAMFRHLFSLEFEDGSLASDCVMSTLPMDELNFPSLRILRTEVSGVTDVPKINQLAPQLSHLYLRISSIADIVDDPTSNPAPPSDLFTHIQYLELHGPPVLSAALRYFASSPLQSLHIRLNTGDHSQERDHLFAPGLSFNLPSALRDVWLTGGDLLADDARRLFIQRCAEIEGHVSIDDFCLRWPSEPVAGSQAGETPDEQDAAHIKDAGAAESELRTDKVMWMVDALCNRADWLVEVKDDHALRGLEKALKPLLMRETLDRL
ncbi:hypothetical protein JCM10296v2_004659 [Rhodotorula toruloides]